MGGMRVARFASVNRSVALHKIGRGAVDARHVSSKGKERSAAYGRHMGTTTES